MKGFGIEIKNDLLDPKHLNNIGVAIWLYMWFLDKMTSIGEDGVGKVLGGKPIKHKEVEKELGINQRTYSRWLGILRQHGYITAIRTPYGISIRVNKAFKRFNKRYDKNGYQPTKNVISNKTVSVDRDTEMKTPSAFSPRAPLTRRNVKRPRMDDIDYNIDEDGNLRPGKKPKGPKPEGKNKIALRLHRKFVELCYRELGTRPVLDIKGYKIVLFALNTGGLTEPQIEDLYDEWFKLGKPDEETVSITRALSARQIEGYKVRNNIA